MDEKDKKMIEKEFNEYSNFHDNVPEDLKAEALLLGTIQSITVLECKMLALGRLLESKGVLTEDELEKFFKTEIESMMEQKKFIENLRDGA